VNDFVGWIAARLEWWVLWLAAADDKGLLSKEKVRAMYDGTLWNVLEREQTAKRGYEIFPPPGKKQPQQQRGKAAAREGATPAKPPPRLVSDGVPEGLKKES
jgi:hypothetical protein